MLSLQKIRHSHRAVDVSYSCICCDCLSPQSCGGYVEKVSSVVFAFWRSRPVERPKISSSHRALKFGSTRSGTESQFFAGKIDDEFFVSRSEGDKVALKRLAARVESYPQLSTVCPPFFHSRCIINARCILCILGYPHSEVKSTGESPSQIIALKNAPKVF